ncbi:MAG: 2-amino-4-ketopentanoate thiolase [Clostridiales bacterium]|nr:2-amino-4-ketopentanoate thiolase [Clostridiales bacterium]
MAKKNDYVRIHRVVLEPAERTGKLPEDTKKVPLEMWVKGRLVNESANIGDEVEVRTAVGRTEHGTLIEENPCYELNYGSFVPEILDIEESLRGALFGGKEV